MPFSRPPRHSDSSFVPIASGMLLFSFVNCPAWHAACFFWCMRCRRITVSPSSLHVRTFVAECRPSSLCHFFAQGHKPKVCPTHAKCGCSIIFRLSLTNLALIVYPYYTLAIPLRFLWQGSDIGRCCAESYCILFIIVCVTCNNI